MEVEAEAGMGTRLHDSTSRTSGRKSMVVGAVAVVGGMAAAEEGVAAVGRIRETMATEAEEEEEEDTAVATHNNLLLWA